MVKRSKVKAIYLVDLFCDKCGSKMSHSKEFNFMMFASNPPTLKYECECGHTTTTTTSYPHFEYEYEEDYDGK